MSKSRSLFFFILLYLLYVVFMPHGGFGIDADAWRRWSAYLLDHSIGGIYDAGLEANYSPLYYYVLWAYAHIQGSIALIDRNIYMLKFFTLLVEFGAVIYMSYMLSYSAYRRKHILICLLNAGFLYNTVVWGQCDGLVGATLLISIIQLWRGRLLASLLFLTLCCYIKFVAIFFLPVWALLALASMRYLNLKTIGAAIAGSILLQLLLLYPFISAGTMTSVIHYNFFKLGYYPFVSFNAYNLWLLLLPGDLGATPDTLLYHGLSYRSWGLIMFVICMILILFPLLCLSVKIWIQKRYALPIVPYLLGGGLTALCFFYFNTEMHERYAHHCLWFFAAYSFYRQRYVLFAVSSIAVFLSIERVVQHLRLTHYDLFIFEPTTISCLYALAIILGFYVFTKELLLSWPFMRISFQKYNV